MSPVKKAAQSHGISVEQPEKLRNEEVIAAMRMYRPDVIVVAAYGLLIPGEILRIPPFGCINIHPSLLPLYRGASPISSAILNGAVQTGVTIMLLDEGMDTGPILSQAEVPIHDADTAATLGEKLAVAGAQLLADTLPQWFAGIIKPQPQDDSRATVTKQAAKDDGRIDWSLPAIKLWRQVRAYNPWPGSFTSWQGKRLRVIEARAAVTAEKTEPGKVMLLQEEGKRRIVVGTGEGVLELIQVQLEGKKALPIHDFILGCPDFSNCQLG
jgi:methionyl-tRNA formyltransferase